MQKNGRNNKMENFLDFIMEALPWLAIGLLLAIFFTRNGEKKMKKRFFIPACVLSAAAVVFVIFALGHPELSFPWDNRMTGTLYGLYADALVLLFILAFCKKATVLNILTIIFELGAVFFLIQAILGLFPDNHVNLYLPLALSLNCIALFFNAVQLTKNKKADTNDRKTDN